MPVRVNRGRKPAVVREVEFHPDPRRVAVINEPGNVIEERYVGPLLHALANPVAPCRNPQRMRDHNLHVHEVDPGVFAQLREAASHQRTVSVVMEKPGEIRGARDLRVEEDATPAGAG